MLLQYGYKWKVDRGSRFWQKLKDAKDLRDYYTHLDVNSPRAISTGQVLEFMEAVLLGIIWPSCELKRTLLLGVYRLYGAWEFLQRHAQEYTEQPFFLDWRLHKELLFHCNFEDVNADRFPSMRDENFYPKPAKTG
jgi:hypothetical protein